MSPNPSGLLEDFVACCVCVLLMFEFVNLLIVMIQGCLIQVLLKKKMLSKESGKSTC